MLRAGKARVTRTPMLATTHKFVQQHEVGKNLRTCKEQRVLSCKTRPVVEVLTWIALFKTWLYAAFGARHATNARMLFSAAIPRWYKSANTQKHTRWDMFKKIFKGK